MSKVGIHVNNKLFTIACDDGQETRVKQLGQYIDERFRELGQAGAAPNESYMLVLTSLVIADEMFEARDAAEQAKMAASNNVGVSQDQLNAEKAAIRQEYAAHIQNLEAQLAAARTQMEQANASISSLNEQVASQTAATKAAQNAAQSAEQAAQQAIKDAAQNMAPSAPVVDLDAARAQWQEESRAKEQDIAKVVDALSRQLETVVKGLKRA